jgi:hypothetical protein
LLSPPPRDLSGRVTPHDHQEILADDGVIRRISPHLVVIDKDGTKRLSSMAFQAASPTQGGGMSVDLQREIEEAGVNAKEFVSHQPWIGAVRFTAKMIRDAGFSVGYDPLPPENPYHGEVWGTFTTGNKKKLQRIAEWFVAIPDVSI